MADEHWTRDQVERLGVAHDLEYDDYLMSDGWLEVRAEALEWACHRCQVCYSDEALEVHHRTYDRLGWEDLADLTVLCAGCHGLFHAHGKLRR